MSAVMELETKGKITKKKADQVFRKLDDTMNTHAKVVNKYFRKLSVLLYEKPKEKKKKRKK